MPKVAKGKRKRAYRPKTSTGCPTCRLRRVKCDETRPACLRCVSTDRICDGYPHVQAPRSSHASIISLPDIAGPALDIEIRASPQSKRSFSYFLQRTRPQLAGFFGSDFWERLVLQAAHRESAVRHALVAIGSVHELSERQTAASDVSRAFALEQYNLAIRELLVAPSQGGERGVDVCLIACILFACLENMQGRHVTAITHIQSGAKLLRETLCDGENGVLRHGVFGSTRQIDSYVPLDVLARIFAGLNSQVAMMFGDEKLKLVEDSSRGTIDSGLPFSFSSVREAKGIFEYGYCLYTRSQPDELSCDPAEYPAAVKAHADHFASLTSKYSFALQAFFESKGSSLTPKEDIAFAVLQLHVLNNLVSLHAEQMPQDSQSRCELFQPHIIKMLALGEKIVSAIVSDDDHGGQATSFCSDMGYVIPLYSVATRTPDLAIRGRAIELLRSTSRQEGLWNSLLAAEAAERVMEIQQREARSCNHRPDWVMSPIVQPFLELDGKGGRLRYIRMEQETHTQIDVVEEVFSW
ncbi:hypothetical protein BJ875DRAFT_293666 [Amylocarpus encephaloides]|uniref:Zn(2)-C6 fungal-type domain-containing protein n=1 Tax=Amylocarpus encephaloides TaxID=45428 RepID=A0A9P8C5N6_9HELO|nr:hypothetical protein BJ875DRAFT_293666 [Amylocarpus encephaloides]